MLRNKGVRTTYYDKNLILDTDNIIHKNFIKNTNLQEIIAHPNTKNITSFDLKLGNLCNLKCIKRVCLVTVSCPRCHFFESVCLLAFIRVTSYDRIQAEHGPRTWLRG